MMVLFLILIATLSWCQRLSGPIDLRYDSSTYFILGTSLAEGKGYRLLNEPGEIQATQYPPLLPLIVAAHELAFGTRDPIVVGHRLRITWFLSYLALTLSIYFMLKRYLPTACAFLGTLICLLSLYTYIISNQLAPEPLFCLTSSLFFISSTFTHTVGRNILSFLFATVSYALRSIGVALFIAWIAEALLRKKFGQASLRVALSLIPIICWQSYIYKVETSLQYTSPPYPYQRAPYLFYNVSYTRNIFALKDPFRPEEGAATIKDVGKRFLDNIPRIPGKTGEAITAERSCWLIPFSRHFPRLSTSGLTLLFGTIGCLVFLGIGLQLYRQEWMMPIYVLVSLAAICLTPWPAQLVRYSTPLCPFMVAAFVSGAHWISQRTRRVWPGSLGVTLNRFFLVIGSLVLIHQMFLYYRFNRYPQRMTYDLAGRGRAQLNVFGYFAFERALNRGIDRLIKEGETKIVACSTPHWVFLRTNAKTVMPPFEIDADKAQALLDAVPVTFLVLEEGFTTEYVSGVVQKHPELWEEVFANFGGKFKIFRRIETPQL